MRCGVALVAPQDPGNLGTVLRTLDAVQGDALFVLDGGVRSVSIRPQFAPAWVPRFWIPVVSRSF